MQKYVTKILKKGQGLTSGKGGKIGKEDDLEKTLHLNCGDNDTPHTTN